MEEEFKKEVKDKLAHIEKLLKGNGKIGVAEMARRSFEYMIYCKRTKNGRLDWAFRVVVGFLLAYVAYKVGIAPTP